MSGDIVIYRDNNNRITWRIDIVTGAGHSNVGVISYWTYASETSAKAAAKRWMKKLGITDPPTTKLVQRTIAPDQEPN